MRLALVPTLLGRQPWPLLLIASLLGWTALVGLQLAIGQVLNGELLAHFGVAFALGAVAFGATLLVEGFAVGGVRALTTTYEHER